jgi:hypothetical protein
VKRRFSIAPLFWLMLATQAIEFLWILLSYLGIEYQRVDARGVLNLDYVPFSHFAPDWRGHPDPCRRGDQMGLQAADTGAGDRLGDAFLTSSTT